MTVLKALRPGDYWVYSITGEITLPPSPQAPPSALPLGGIIINEIQMLPFRGKPTLALVASQNLTVAGTSIFGQNTPPKGIFYLQQNPVTKDVLIVGDNLGENGADRVTEQPQVFYPGYWSAATAYDHTIGWNSGATTRLTLSVTGSEIVPTALGHFSAWKAPTGSVESSGVVNTGTDWWTPQLGAPVKFDTVTVLPNGGINHVVGTLIQSNKAPSIYPVVAGALNHPRGLAFDSQGSLWITEAGVGGTGPCVGSQDGSSQCFGASGMVSRIRDGVRETITSGLGSLATPLLDQATGPNGITFRGDTPFITIGNPGTETVTNDLGDFQKSVGILTALDPTDAFAAKTAALLSRFEFLYRPDNVFDPQGNPRAESNPFGVTSMGENIYGTDSAGHTALKISPDGNISALAVLPFQSVDKPAFPGGPVPTIVESVPTAIIPAPDGRGGLLVADYTGYPFFPGTSRIWRVREGQTPEVFASGFTNLIGLASAPDGGVYALEMTSDGFLSGNPAGEIIYISPSGAQTTIACQGLIYPTGITTGPDGDMYVSNYGVIPGKGQVIRIHPNLP